MWIERPNKKARFIELLSGLKNEVLILRGARQVGKTSFVLNVLNDLSNQPQIRINLNYPGSFHLKGYDYFGRDFTGQSEGGETLLKNIEAELGSIKNLAEPAIIFIDEVDRHPAALEFIQALAEFSDKLKFIFTGSNLENIPVKNAATGRKRGFDLYPITFEEFVSAAGCDKLVAYMNSISPGNAAHSELHHKRLNELKDVYIRIGGMPRIVDAYLSADAGVGRVPDIIKDMAVSIEENVKTVLGEKSKLYEYEDVLRKIAVFSMNTLKFNRLQVQHAGRSEAKKLVAKTVGARVAHKIRLFDSESDLSKYIIFDCGIANYLLNGSDVLKTLINERNTAILYETFVGLELISGLVTRDDLFYWKSENIAEVEFLLRSPFIGIDVKTKTGDIKSLNSLAIFEKNLSCVVKVYDGPFLIKNDHMAALPNANKRQKITMLSVPHYLAYRIPKLVEESIKNVAT